MIVTIDKDLNLYCHQKVNKLIPNIPALRPSYATFWLNFSTYIQIFMQSIFHVTFQLYKQKVLDLLFGSNK